MEKTITASRFSPFDVPNNPDTFKRTLSLPPPPRFYKNPDGNAVVIYNLKGIDYVSNQEGQCFAISKKEKSKYTFEYPSELIDRKQKDIYLINKELNWIKQQITKNPQLTYYALLSSGGLEERITP